MFGVERRESIIKIISREKSVSVNDLAKRVYASPATIRRDLNELEKLGLVKRFHGGVILTGRENNEMSFLVREHENVHGKKKIAEAAAQFIKSPSSIFLDSSSTASMLVPVLSRFHSLTVFTTGLKTAILLSKTSARIYMPGGLVNSRYSSLAGADTNAYLDGVFADVVFVSCKGIHEEGGVTELSQEQAMIKKTVLKNAKRKILLCDSSKFGLKATFKVADFSAFDCIITNHEPPEELKRKLEDAGCKIILA